MVPGTIETPGSSSVGAFSDGDTVYAQNGVCGWCGARGSEPMCGDGHEADTYTWTAEILGGAYHQIGVATPLWNGRGTDSSNDYDNFAVLYSHHSGWNRHRGAAREVDVHWGGTWDHTNKGRMLDVTLDCSAHTFNVRTENENLGTMSYPDDWTGTQRLRRSV